MTKKWLINAASVAACAMPVIHYLYVVLFWLLARAALGHWPEPGANDPKGFFFGIPATLGIILMLMSFAVVPFIVFLGYRRHKLPVYLAAYAASLVISILLFRADILQITTWIAD